MEIIGFIFGLGGLSFALQAKEQLSKLKVEFDELKYNLEKSGVLSNKIEPE